MKPCFDEKAGPRAKKIRHWVEKNGFGGMLVAALLPPPTPFKFFVLAAGVFEVPLASFTSAIALGARGSVFRDRISGRAVRLAGAAVSCDSTSCWSAAVVIVLVALSYAISRFILREERIVASGK